MLEPMGLPILDAGSGVLPPLFADWVAALVGGAIPPEPRATCASCAMCVPPEIEAAAERAGLESFRPDVKCCSYHPDLPNFLAGRILADPDPALARGRAAIEARLRAREGATPLGIRRPAHHALVSRAHPDAFGQSRALICPYFVDEGGGLCGIWRHREGVCATFFCKHTRGATGQRFWAALRELLKAVELALAGFCLGELGAGEEDWAGWEGREADFYRACAALVDPLPWARALELAGPVAASWARAVREAYAALVSADLPPALALAPVAIAPLGAEACRVVSYSRYDPIVAPRALFAVLPLFDGRPPREAIAAIAAERGVHLEDDLVRALADFGVLYCPPDRQNP